jgi:hypothetical protein
MPVATDSTINASAGRTPAIDRNGTAATAAKSAAFRARASFDGFDIVFSSELCDDQHDALLGQSFA